MKEILELRVNGESHSVAVEPNGPFGAKEVGEGAIAGVLAAVGNAVYDAVGVRFRSLPINSEKILQALEGKGG